MGISLCETPAKENAKTSIWTKYSKQTSTQPRRLGRPANSAISRPCGPSSRAPQRRSDAPFSAVERTGRISQPPRPSRLSIKRGRAFLKRFAKRIDPLRTVRSRQFKRSSQYPTLMQSFLWLSPWDKCERLRRGLLQAFCDNLWPPEFLSSMHLTEDLRRDLFRHCAQTPGLWALAEALKSGQNFRQCKSNWIKGPEWTPRSRRSACH